MGQSRFDPAMKGHVAWNAGKTVGTKLTLENFTEARSFHIPCVKRLNRDDFS